MKKTLCVLLAILMIVSLFTGCAGELGLPRICVIKPMRNLTSSNEYFTNTCLFSSGFAVKVMF